MNEEGEVRPQGGIYELCSDISKNWRDMRNEFGYKLLSEIAGERNRRR